MVVPPFSSFPHFTPASPTPAMVQPVKKRQAFLWISPKKTTAARFGGGPFFII
jgi:hypothetical protein